VYFIFIVHSPNFLRIHGRHQFFNSFSRWPVFAVLMELVVWTKLEKQMIHPRCSLVHRLLFGNHAQYQYR
jgi:hypothetical protein